MGDLTKHFSLAEFEASQTATRAGIPNRVPPDLMANLARLADTLEQVRAVLDAPIHITSGYRSLWLNKRVGGAKTSQHTRALACDFVAPAFGTPRQICHMLVQAGVRFDQLIEEGTWVHISVPENGQPWRREILRARFIGGKAVYYRGLE
jgi:hypothetical protein